MLFSAHPIRFPDGTLSIPESDWEMTEHPLFIAAKRTMEEYFEGDISDKTIIDLGALEGGFAAEFARIGMKSIGLEVRSTNIERCEIVRDRLGLTNLSFVQDDCWNLENYGSFDVIFCSGLLYHLNDPAKFLRMASRLCGLLVLDTHYAYETPSKAYSLSEKTTHEGYEGRWYIEYPKGHNTKDDTALWTSWGNDKSFWPMKGELVRMVKDAGFDIRDTTAFERPEIERMTIIANSLK